MHLLQLKHTSWGWGWRGEREDRILAAFRSFINIKESSIEPENNKVEKTDSSKGLHLLFEMSCIWKTHLIENIKWGRKYAS